MNRSLLLIGLLFTLSESNAQEQVKLTVDNTYNEKVHLAQGEGMAVMLVVVD